MSEMIFDLQRFSSDGDVYFTGSSNTDKFSGGDGNDTIDGGAGNDSLSGGAGNDVIIGGKGNDTLTGGKGADVFVYNSGDGNDLITDYAEEDKIKIASGKIKSVKKSGNDVVFTIGSGKITLAGAASKTVTYIGANGKINYFPTAPASTVVLTDSNTTAILRETYSDSTYTAGSSIIKIDASSVTRDLSITGNAKANVILGGSGDDTIYGGKGNDTLQGGEGSNLYVYNSGDGNDLILNWGSSDTLSIASGEISYNASVKGDTVIFPVGKGKISLQGAADEVIHFYNSDGEAHHTILVSFDDGDADADSDSDGMDISNENDSTRIDGTSYADTISNDGENVTINGGAGKDYIENWGWYVTINGGDGNDSIINGWSGNCGHYSSISGGNGNDYIENDMGEDVTINAGAGNDTIGLDVNNFLYSERTLIQYKAGDGNDLIQGFRADSTLSIAGGSYSTAKSGKNIIVTVGEGKISLIGAASLSTVNIVGGEESTATTSTKLTVTNSTKSPVTVGSSVKVIDASKRTKAVKITGNKLDNTIYGGSGNDTLTGGMGNDVFVYSAGKDVITDYAEEDLINIASGTVSMIKTSGKHVVFTVGSGKITLAGAAAKTVSYLEGGVTKTYGDTTPAVEVNGKTVTLTKNYTAESFDLSDYAKTVRTIDASAVTHGLNLTGNKLDNSILGGAGNDTIDGYSGNDSLWGGDGSDIFIYYDGDGNDTIFDYTSGDMLQILDGTLDNSKYSNGTLTLGISGGGSVIFENVTTSTTFNINGETYKISGSKLVKDGSSGGSSNAWKLSGTTATYGTSSNTLVKVTGVKSLDGISLSKKVVTVAASALNKSDVSITGSGYTLKLASDVATPTKKAAAWAYKSGTATYKSSSTTAGYSLASNSKSITYTKATAASTLATVKGVKSKDGLSVNGKVITVAASALNKSKVTITGSGYTLKLADDVSKSTTKKAAWTYKSGTATYKSSSKTAGYSLASNAKSISYTKAKAASTLTTVKGVKSAEGLTVSGKVVTVAASALNKSNVTITGGYKLKLADDVSTSTDAKTDWGYKSSVATLSQTKGEKYSLASNGKTISYSAGTSKNLAKLSGVNSANGLPTSGKVITVPNSIIATSKKVSVNGTGYEFKFAAQKTSITGSANADIITSTGANTTINGGEGNDSINISGTNNVIVYKSGDGSDTVTNYSEDDTIKITSGAAQVTTSGSNVVFSVGNGSILLKGAADKTVSYISNGTATTFSANSSDSSDSSDPYTISKDGKGVTLSSSYSEENFDVSEITGGNKIVTIDASAVTHKLKIKGNSLANKIIGGKAGGILDGGKGTASDTLIGGDGSDIFIYYDGDGNDVIKGYNAKDTITIEEGVVSTIEPSREDVVFQVGDGKLTVQDVKGTHISFVENGIEYGCLDGKRTLTISQTKNDTIATLSKNYRKDSFDVTKIGNEDVGNSITKIYASSVARTLKITGNDKANQILGSATKANTITGGGGPDTLQGGSGADVFVYAAGDGKDVIYNFGVSDVISIVSGKVDYTTLGGDDNKSVILKIGDGQIVLDNAAGQKITYYDTEHTSKPFSGIPSNVVEDWFVADDDNFATNDLSALVQSKAADYSLAEVETSLKSANALDKLTYSTKK